MRAKRGDRIILYTIDVLKEKTRLLSINIQYLDSHLKKVTGKEGKHKYENIKDKRNSSFQKNFNVIF